MLLAGTVVNTGDVEKKIDLVFFFFFSSISGSKWSFSQRRKSYIPARSAVNIVQRILVIIISPHFGLKNGPRTFCPCHRHLKYLRCLRSVPYMKLCCCPFMFLRIANDSGTRGHSLALVKCHSRLEIRKHTFSQRVVVNYWNRLPDECVNATGVNMFKNRVDRYFLKTGGE